MIHVNSLLSRLHDVTLSREPPSAGHKKYTVARTLTLNTDVDHAFRLSQ